MSTLTLNITAKAPEKLRACLRLLRNRRPLMDDLGGETAKRLRGHFRARDAAPNKTGFPKQHFWNRAVAQNTTFTGADNDTATVTIASALFPLKLYGGVVRPRTAKYLALPMHPAAYGNTPRSGAIAGLIFILGKKGKRYLVREEAGKMVFYYRLVPKAVHRPDPHALPDLAALERDLAARAERYIERSAS